MGDCAPRGQTMDELVKSIKTVNRTAEILQCTYCNIEPSRVLEGSGFNRSMGAWSPDRALLDIERVHVEVGVGTGESTGVKQESSADDVSGTAGGNNDSDEVRCVSVRIDGDLDLDAF